MKWTTIPFILCLAVPAAASQGFRLDGTITEGGGGGGLAGGGTATGDIKFNDDVQLEFGTGSDNVCEYDTAVTPDALVCGLGADSRIWYFAEAADVGTDWAKAQQTNPTLCVQSADATSTTDRICLTHDQTDAVISSDAGAVIITAFNGDLEIREAANDGNPQIRLGAVDAEELSVRVFYDAGAQTLDYVEYSTAAASATADKGRHIFDVDGTNILRIDDDGIEMLSGGVTLENDETITNAVDGTVQIDAADLKLNVTGTATIQALGTVAAEVKIDGGNTQALTFNSTAAGLHWSELDLKLFGNDNSFLVTSAANRTKNHHHSSPTNPTMFFHSAADADADATQWTGITHDQTDGHISTGAGDLHLEPAGSDVVITGALTVTTYEICVDVQGEAATLGPTSPSSATNASVAGLGFDAVGEQLYLHWEVPDCWDGASDMTLKVYWAPTTADAPADTEDVDWELTYRSINWGTDDTDNGTAVTINADYTQSGAGNAEETFITTQTIDYDNADQTIAVGDVISGPFNRDVTNEANSYSGEGIVARIEICFDATTPQCDHQ